ncbi:MAG: type I 3-dehydroquinate dehydratase [Methanoregulaceae archaeon]|jgi:3-dehydroquinate dehydratase-1
MRIVASLTDPNDVVAATDAGADLIEVRFDLMKGEPEGIVQEFRRRTKLPLIATLRSSVEGGKFSGNTEEWFQIIKSIISHIDYIDIERRFSTHADTIKKQGKTIIASYHTKEMPQLFELFTLERDLRMYGDIPKIVVAPGGDEDIIELFFFTHAAKKPICLSIMGGKYRYARIILPLIGSEFVYCHIGKPTAEGQFSIGELKTIMGLISS